MRIHATQAERLCGAAAEKTDEGENGMEYKYVKELADAGSIQNFFERNHVELPGEFDAFFKKNNGGRPSSNLCVLKNGEEKVVNNFLSFNENDRENVYKAKRSIEADDRRPIPFAKDPAGNYYCLLEGAVVFYTHEDGEITEIADSFQDFTGQLHERDCLYQ